MPQDQHPDTVDLLRRVLDLHLESLALLHTVKQRLEKSRRRMRAGNHIPEDFVRFEPPQPPDKNKPPLVPEGHYVICMRCAYQWVPIRTRRPSLCADCNAPWWYAAQHRWRNRKKKA